MILSTPQLCNIPFGKFNKMLEYEKNYSLRSFFKLNNSFEKEIQKYNSVSEFSKKNQCKD